MRNSFAVALSVLVLNGPVEAAGPGLETRLTPTTDHPGFGGLSGVDLGPLGLSGLVISDRGDLFAMTLERSPDGALQDIDIDHIVGLRAPGTDRTSFDAEGLVVKGQQNVVLSLEQPSRVIAVDPTSKTKTPLPVFPNLQIARENKGLEALALDDEGRLLALPEVVPSGATGFPIFRLQSNQWHPIGILPKLGPFAVVGADFGPDGQLYVLERAFSVLGFRTRIRRVQITETVGPADIILQSHVAQYDNMEGIAVWRDHLGVTRVLLVSDDNFLATQETEFLEFVIQD